MTEMVKGRSGAGTLTIKALADFFHVNEEWLEYGTGEKERKFEVTTVYEPEKQTGIDNPKKKIIYAYVDALSADDLDEEIERYAAKFSAARNTKKP